MSHSFLKIAICSHKITSTVIQLFICSLFPISNLKFFFFFFFFRFQKFEISFCGTLKFLTFKKKKKIPYTVVPCCSPGKSTWLFQQYQVNIAPLLDGSSGTVIIYLNNCFFLSTLPQFFFLKKMIIFLL